MGGLRLRGRGLSTTELQVGPTCVFQDSRCEPPEPKDSRALKGLGFRLRVKGLGLGLTATKGLLLRNFAPELLLI